MYGVHRITEYCSIKHKKRKGAVAKFKTINMGANSNTVRYDCGFLVMVVFYDLRLAMTHNASLLSNHVDWIGLIVNLQKTWLSGG